MTAPYQLIVESAQEGVYTVDTRWRIRYANPSLGQLLGVPSEKLLGRSIFRFLAQPDRATALRRWRRPNYTRQPLDLRLEQSNGDWLWVLVTATPFFDSSRNWVGTMGVVTDISELRNLRKRLIEAETEKKRFSREVLASVTGGKFRLVDREEIPDLGSLLVAGHLGDAQAFQRLRDEVRQAAHHAGMSDERCDEFIMAVGEAAGNAIKHAGGGQTQVRLGGDRLVVRIVDEGSGIHCEDLPSAILKAGYSTKVSLGLGYSMMLELVDAIWLATGPEGTVVQLEKWLQPQAETDLLEHWTKVF